MKIKDFYFLKNGRQLNFFEDNVIIYHQKIFFCPQENGWEKQSFLNNYGVDHGLS